MKAAIDVLFHMYLIYLYYIGIIIVRGFFDSKLCSRNLKVSDFRYIYVFLIGQTDYNKSEFTFGSIC